jgi:hypothetical protein
MVELIGEILKYAVPAILVMVTTKLILDSKRAEREQESQLLLKQEMVRQHLPLRLAAYERLVLFLERISPEQLLMRVSPQNLRAGEFRRTLTGEIRAEFEHNLAQQIYVSPQGWQALVQAKEAILALIHEAQEGLEEGAAAQELGQRIIAVYTERKQLPTHQAILLLKQDIQKLFVD